MGKINRAIVGVNDLQSQRPDLAKEWHPTMNGGLTPSEIGFKSTKKVWWICPKGHSWPCAPEYRVVRGTTCTVCSGKRLVPGINDLASLRPDLMKEWDYTRNININPRQLKLHSNKEAHWICKYGHDWSAYIKDRTKENGTGCPYCANQKVWTGFNDLAFKYPELAAEWHPFKNDSSPDKVLAGGNKDAWWICPLGHPYNAHIKDRIAGNGCPYCAGKKVLIGFNDLMTTHPSIAKEWDFENNGDLTPEQVSAGMKKKVFWKCSLNHSYPCRIYSRIAGNGCAYCSNQKVLSGFNDLKTRYPQIAQEWDYNANGSVKPEDILPNTRKQKYHWICQRGHKWEEYPNERVQGSGCPTCSKEYHSSFPEQAIYYYINKIINTINRYKVEGFEIDIFIPHIKLGIEYDGIFYHTSEEAKLREKKKDRFCKKNGITLFHVKESYEDLPSNNGVIYRNLKRTYCGLNETIYEILHILNTFDISTKEIEVDTFRDRHKIISQYVFNSKENSVAAKHPDLALEWDYESNHGITPDQVSSGSNKKYYWLCPQGHSYPADPKHRVAGTGCTYCAGKEVLVGFNDLLSKYPNICLDWDYSKNEKLPSEYTTKSNKDVYWKCHICGDEWHARIAKRTSGGSNCKTCRENRINRK